MSARQPAGRPTPTAPTVDDVLAAFLAQGLYGPMHLRAPTGSGGFEASYVPAAAVELIRIGGGVSFRDAIAVRGGRAFSDLPSLRPVVREINDAPEKAQPALLRPYQWTPSARAAWLARLEAVVEGFWSGVFRFHVDRPGWDGVRARTAVDVDVHEGPKRPDDHLSIEVFQVPDHVNAGVGILASGRGPRDNRMQLGASDVGPRPDNMLAERFSFRAERTGASDTDSIRLSMLAIRFRAGSNDPPKMTWHVQGDGPEPKVSARVRFDAIVRHMAEQGFDPGRARFVFDGPGRIARVVVGDGAAQHAAVHEFGHALGLKDEYARDHCAGLSGTGKPAGVPSDHDALARRVGLPGSVHENNEGMMSFGNLMRPSYAATCLWALRILTGVDDWVAGQAAAPSGAGNEKE